MYLMIDNYDSFVHNLAVYFRELGCTVDLVRNDKLDLCELQRLVNEATERMGGRRSETRDACDTENVCARDVCAEGGKSAERSAESSVEGNAKGSAKGSAEETRDWLEGIVISPGPKSPNECGLCKEALAIAAGKVPVLGVCLGHQIIAASYGATVAKGMRPMHGKVSMIHNNRSGLFENLPSSFKVTRYHSLVVLDSEFPSCLRVDARSTDGAIMAISHRELPIYGVQFHPEAVLTEYGHDILKAFTSICDDWQRGAWVSTNCRMAG